MSHSCPYAFDWPRNCGRGVYCIRCYVEHGTRMFLRGVVVGIAGATFGFVMFWLAALR